MNQQQATKSFDSASARASALAGPPVNLPEAVATLSNGRNLESKCDPAIELLSYKEAGIPPVAHLSSGELQLDTSGLLRIALRSSSQTSANLRDTDVATLVLVCPEGLFEFRCGCLAFRRLAGHETLKAFLIQPLSVRDKAVSYARVLSRIRYRLLGHESTLRRWDAVQAALASCF